MGALHGWSELETLGNEVKRVIGGGVSNWAAVESQARARVKSGERSFFVYIFSPL